MAPSPLERTLMKPINLFAISVVVGLSVSTPIVSLSLGEFLDQVASNNLQIQTAQKSISAARQRIKSTELITMPKLSTSYGFITEDKISNYSRFMGNKSSMHLAEATIQKQFDNGLMMSVGYKVDSYDYPQMTPQPMAYADAIPYVELNYPLMRNATGRSTRAINSGIEENILASIKLNEFAVDTCLVSAEMAYWRLALAKDSVQIADEAVARARKMVDWAQNRQSLQLGNTSELLQVQSLLKLRELEYRQALDDEASATRALNQFRTTAVQTAPDRLDSISDTDLTQRRPRAMVTRKDVIATQHLVRAIKANGSVDSDALEPALNILGRLSLNQNGAGVSDAISRTLATDHWGTFIGVQFTGAFDFNSTLIQDLKQGISANITAAESDLQTKKVAARDQWTELTSRLSDTQDRINTIQRIEAVQLNRWRAEMDLHRRGRSILIQVLNAEQDYANARLMHLRARGEILTILAQLKLYEGDR
ncbi:hypothetical protein EB093_01620 [bacterium]|nr:hypothetical protein [bacterium]